MVSDIIRTSHGPNYIIRDGRAHHVNETDGDPGAPAELGDDEAWRLGRG